MSNPSSSLVPTQLLSTGSRMPVIGLGLWKVAPADCADTVVAAIRAGYRHLDCACDYGNEREVGEGIRRALDEGLCTREELWITSKLWNTFHAREHVRPALERSLEDLGLEYVDLYLVHFPIALAHVPFETRYPPEWVHDPEADPPVMVESHVPLEETWHAMEALFARELAHAIGVCNYNVGLLRDLMNQARVPPAVLQVESHPYLTQDKLLRFCREQDIAVTAFSPFGASSYVELDMARGDEAVIERTEIVALAERVERTPAQVVLRWALQRGTSIVTKTTRPERLVENAALFDFELGAADMAAISALNRNRRYNDPGEFAEAAFGTFYPIYE